MAMLRSVSEMKDSGIEWYGTCPISWNKAPLYSALKEINQKNAPIVTTNILSLTNTEGVIPYSERGNQGNKSKDNLEEYKVVYPNTIVANSMNILIGSVGLSAYKGCVSPVYYVYEAKPQYDIRYLNYLFRMESFQKRLRQFANGIMEIRLRVSSHDILHQNVMMPSFEEQRDIADYLDDRCSKLDEVIAEAEKSIEEYKELKQTVITEAVIGLRNDKSTFKSCDSRWVNKIPNDWNKIKIHYIVKMPVIDGPHVSPELVSDGVPYVSANAIVDGKIDFSKKRGYITREYSNECRKRYSPCKNDILVVKLGASTGKMAIVEDFTDFDIWVPLAVVRCKDDVNAKYVFYSMQSEYFCNEIRDGWTFGTQETLGLKTIEKLYIFLPKDRKEQDEIVKYLDMRIPQINALVSEKQSLIEDLKSYKKSLIYEVVTGKRRVV